MSLNWKLTDIKNHETVCWYKIEDPEMAESIRKNGTRGFFAPAWHTSGDNDDVYVMENVTNSLIWMMMGLGLKGTITEKNIDEAIVQIALYQQVYGAPLQVPNGEENGETTYKPYYITEQDIRNHIGIYTNCFGKENSKAAFNRNIVKTLRENAVAWLEERT